MKKKFILAMLTATVTAAALAGCGQKDNSTNNETISKSDDGKVTIKVFSNLPDRKNGQGLVEQKIIDEYMEENQNVEIKVEALDEEAYKTKFKAYSMEGMPDVVSIWGQLHSWMKCWMREFWPN